MLGLESRIGALPEANSHLVHVDGQLWGIHVEFVGSILNSHEELVLVEREHDDSAKEFEHFGIVDKVVNVQWRHGRLVGGDGLFQWNVVLLDFGKEKRIWLVDVILNRSLGRMSACQVKDIEPVSGIHFHAVALRIGFIQCLTNAAIVVNKKSTVMDNFNHAILDGC